MNFKDKKDSKGTKIKKNVQKNKKNAKKFGRIELLAYLCTRKMRLASALTC